jgi:hypothetical protein
MGTAKVGASEGGAWARRWNTMATWTSFGEPPITYTYPVTMAIEIVVVACASNAVPTLMGCFTAKPDITTPYMDVGSFRVFNQAGFSCPFTTCMTVIQPGPGATLPAIVWKDDWIGGQQDRWVTVAGYPIYFDTTITPMYFSLSGSIWLAYDDGFSQEQLEVFSGVAVGHPDVNDPYDYGYIAPLGTEVYASPPLAASDAANLHIKINVQAERAEAAASLTRQVQTSPGMLENFTFDLAWTVQAEGYAYMANKSLAVASMPAQAQVASLTLLFGAAWDMDYTDVHAQRPLYQPARLPGYYGDGGVGTRIPPASLGSTGKG